MQKFTIILEAKRGGRGVFQIECKEVFKAIERAAEIIKSAKAKYSGAYSIKDAAGNEVVKSTSMA